MVTHTFAASAAPLVGAIADNPKTYPAIASRSSVKPAFGEYGEPFVRVHSTAASKALTSGGSVGSPRPRSMSPARLFAAMDRISDGGILAISGFTFRRPLFPRRQRPRQRSPSA